MTRARDIADQQDNLGGAVAPYVSGKNMLINGGFDNWQRGTTFTGFGTGVYTADRWFAVSNSATYTVTRMDATSTEPVGSNYFARIQATVAGIFDFTLCQPIESAIFNAAKGQEMTISFYARSSTNASVSVFLKRNTSEGKVFYYEGTTIASRFVTLNSSWVRYTVSVPAVPKSNTDQGLTLNLQTSSGLGSIIDFFGVQMEFGSAATPFSRAGGSIGGELALCQRYYQRWAISSFTKIGTGVTYDSSNIFACVVPIKTTMRATPTLAAAGLAAFDGSGTYTATLGTNLSTTNNIAFDLTVSGAVALRVQQIGGNNTANAYFEASAEL